MTATRRPAFPASRASYLASFSLSILAPAAACSAGPPTHAAPLPPSSSPKASPSASASVLAPAPKAALPPDDASRRRLAHAYEERARGEAEQARADFEELAALLVAAGWKRAPGLGDGHRYVVAGRATAGLTMRGAGDGTLFFDIKSGEPFAFAPGLELRRSAPPLDGSYFATEDNGPELHLFDPARAALVDLPDALIALHPDGHRVYLLGEDCQLEEWSLAKGRVTAKLAPHTTRTDAAEQRSRACSSHTFRDAAVTADGRWLTARVGRWDLSTHAYRPLPFRWNAPGYEYEPAVSPDGRHVARVIENPRAPKESPGEAEVLALYDLDAGTMRTAPGAFSAVSNGDPLWFGSHPDRVCIFDFGMLAFKLPSLRRFEEGDPDYQPNSPPRFDCISSFTPPPPEHPELEARLASRVFSVGGLPFPVDP
jgi:hypothetical protein